MPLSFKEHEDAINLTPSLYMGEPKVTSTTELKTHNMLSCNEVSLFEAVSPNTLWQANWIEGPRQNDKKEQLLYWFSYF